MSPGSLVEYNLRYLASLVELHKTRQDTWTKAKIEEVSAELDKLLSK